MKNNVSRELSDIARDFQASQMRANELYNAIGKAYFNKTRYNPSGEFVQLFSDLESVLRQQEQMETRRKFLNGIVVCTNCKADNTVELSFCASCGTRLPHKMAPVEDGRIRCTNCGNILQPGQAFCGNCGTKAPIAEPQPPVAPVAEQAAPIAEPVAPVVESVAPVEPVATAVVEPVVVPAAEKPVEVVSETIVVEAPAEAVAEPVAEVSEEPVNETPAAEEIAATETSVAETPKEEFYSSPEEFKMFCGNCGTMITNPEAAFCPNCGNRLAK